MHLQLYFLLLIPLSLSQKIVTFWGVVEKPNTPVEYQTTWMDCMSRCYWDDQCVAIQQKGDYGCQVFPYGKVSVIRKTDSGNGNRVGVKRRTSQCSPTFSAEFEGKVVNETYRTETLAYQYSISSATLKGITQLTFSYNYYIECPDDSFVLLRGDNQICMAIRVFPTPAQAWRAGSELCLSDGIGLSGPYDRAEVKEIALRLDKVPLIPTPYSYTFRNYWIDGIGTGSGYNLSDSSLNGSSAYRFTSLRNNVCVFMTALREEVQTQSCTLTQSTENSYCYRGAVCRVQHIVQY